MTCFHPLKGFRSKSRNKNGKRSIVFNPSQAMVDMPVILPCGQCIGCRLERSRQWAIRCVHEAQMHVDNCFITLTYDDAHIPSGRTLILRDFQLFMKRLRKKYNNKIRFFHCGEYGDLEGRPHYHAILFGHDFADKKLWKNNLENPLYRSNDLELLWPYGYSSIGAVTFQSAAYVARYIMKKVTGENAAEHYEYVDLDGEIHERKPEYTTMSRRPGIGSTWLHAYQSDVFPADFIVLEARKMQPPKYYDRQLEITDLKEHNRIKFQRIRRAKENQEDQTPERLLVREQVKASRTSQLKRTLE